MKKQFFLVGTADEVAEQIQESIDRANETTRKWAEMLTFDPDPQTGISPKDVVWRKNKSRLYRYISNKGIKYRPPVLLIYALINKAYILDLYPGMSLVEYLVDSGFDVYMLEWGEFQWEDRKLSYADLVFDYIANAARKVCQFSRCDEISIIGYCMGGTMAAMYASLSSLPRIKNMVYIASPIDFSEAGVSSVWFRDKDFKADKIVDTYQLIPSDFIDYGVKMLNPVNNFLGTYTRLWKMIDEDLPVQSWKLLNKWVNDNINFPGEAYRQWTKDIYSENKLINKQFQLRGMRVDLSTIEANTLALAGQNDHIVSSAQVEAVMDVISSPDKKFIEYPVGHGGLVFGSIARHKVYPAIANWLKVRSRD
ncbi:MAG: alpha/beta fold hydrolase [Syntrophomonadaceae bacterium]|nr:alpha/beta fold hydrolase [Syntrophomonadaceae bacterium]